MFSFVHIHDYLRLARMDRPVGALLLLWPTLWALWLATAGQPPRDILLIFVLGVWLMRSAGCVINDIADRNFDPLVTRTRERPLAAGRLALPEAVGVFLILCLAAFGLVLWLNHMTQLLAIIGLGLAVSYPFMKRYHSLPQVHLGVAFGWAIPMAFAATGESLPLMAWWLLLCNIVWSVIYDTQYAMVDRQDDLQAGVKSSAILFGHYDRLIIGLLQGVLLLLLLICGQLANLEWPFYLLLLPASACLLWQQWLIRHREAGACLRAFAANNWFGAFVFFGLLLNYLP